MNPGISRRTLMNPFLWRMLMIKSANVKACLRTALIQSHNLLGTYCLMNGFAKMWHGWRMMGYPWPLIRQWRASHVVATSVPTAPTPVSALHTAHSAGVGWLLQKICFHSHFVLCHRCGDCVLSLAIFRRGIWRDWILGKPRYKKNGKKVTMSPYVGEGGSPRVAFLPSLKSLGNWLCTLPNWP